MINNLPITRSNRSRPIELHASHREPCNAVLTHIPGCPTRDEPNDEKQHSVGPEILGNISLKVDAPFPPAAVPLWNPPGYVAFPPRFSDSRCRINGSAAMPTCRHADLQTCRHADIPDMAQNS